MSDTGVWFEQSESEVVETAGYHSGELVGGCRADVISDVDADIRSLFDCTKASRSIDFHPTDLSVGMIVDLGYRKSSNSVNTPYRVADIHVDSGKENSKFDSVDYNFRILFEPIIQNASLVLLSGFKREYEESDMYALQDVYYKRKWDTPEIEGFDSMSYPSEYYDLGFEEKDRRMDSISILFDEVIAEHVGLEDELVPLVI